MYVNYIKFNIWNRSTFLNKHLILEGWKNLLVGILWKYLTARYLVSLGPSPAAGHQVTHKL